MRAAAISLAAALLIAAAFFFLRSNEPPPAPIETRKETSPAAPAPLAAAGRPLPTAPLAKAGPSPGPALPALPRVLSDTQVDGTLKVDAQGHLVLSREVLHLFNYFLGAEGDESDATIRARTLAEIDRRLQEPARSEAHALLDKFERYREQGRSLSIADDASLQDRLDAQSKLRRDVFGEKDADALFGEDEAVDRAAVKRQKIETDPTLTPEQKLEREQALEAELPEEIRKERAATIAPLQQQQAEEELRREGATDEDLLHYREQTVGKEAAQRLGDLDQQRAQWNSRLATFDQERAQIAASNLSPDAQAAAVQQLLQKEFSPTERLRVTAIKGLPLDPTLQPTATDP